MIFLPLMYPAILAAIPSAIATHSILKQTDSADAGSPPECPNGSNIVEKQMPASGQIQAAVSDESDQTNKQKAMSEPETKISIQSIHRDTVNAEADGSLNSISQMGFGYSPKKSEFESCIKLWEALKDDLDLIKDKELILVDIAIAKFQRKTHCDAYDQVHPGNGAEPETKYSYVSKKLKKIPALAERFNLPLSPPKSKDL